MTVTAKAAAAATPEKKGMNRREFLNFAWLASLGFLTVNMAGMTYLFAMPRFKEGEFGGCITVGTVSDLPEAGSAPVKYPQGETVAFEHRPRRDGDLQSLHPPGLPV